MTISQLNMLKLFRERQFTYEQALKLDQRIFGGLCGHIWVDWNPTAKHFHLTEGGEFALSIAVRVHNFRKVNNGKFSIRVPRIAQRVRPISIRRGAA